MLFVTKVIAVFLIAAGCVLMLRPLLVKNMLDFIKKDNRIYVVAMVRILVGFLFINVSFLSRVTWVVFSFGLLALASGVLIFLLKKDKVIELAERMIAESMGLIGTIPLLLGVLLYCSL
jgi:hypothetical protein